jgi:hypothetical protein
MFWRPSLLVAEEPRRSPTRPFAMASGGIVASVTAEADQRYRARDRAGTDCDGRLDPVPAEPDPCQQLRATHEPGPFLGARASHRRPRRRHLKLERAQAGTPSGTTAAIRRGAVRPRSGSPREPEGARAVLEHAATGERVER